MMFSSWGFAAAGAAAVSIPIIIHYMNKMHRKPVYWGAMRFVMEAYQKQRSRLQIEQLILLAVRCCILLFLGFALAGMMLPAGCSMIGSQKRVIHLVIDDALSSQVADQVDHKNRFELSKKQALDVLSGLGGNDKVSVTFSAKPVVTHFAEGSLDHDQVKELIEKHEVRHSQSQLDQALDNLSVAITKAETDRAAHFVTVFSGFTKDTMKLNNERRRKLGDMIDQVKFVFAKPMNAVSNYQVTHVRPDWRMQIFLKGAKKVTIPVEVGVKRYAEQLTGRESELQVQVLNEDHTEVLVDKIQNYQWVSGQEEDKKVRFNLVVPTENLGLTGDSAKEGAVLSIRVQLKNKGEEDLIVSDDVRFTSVELRSVIHVAVVDDYSVLPEEGKHLQRDWVKMALSPRTSDDANPTSYSVEEVNIDTLKADALKAADAILLVKPDALDAKKWALIGEQVRAGKMLWVHPTADTLDNTWGTQMVEALGVKWKVGLESKELEEDQKPWEVAIGDVPNELSRLTVDWEELLKPVKMYRYVPFTGDDQTVVWLKDNQGNPIFAQRKVGQGVVYFSAFAIDDQWTNLMIKHFYTALYHETLVTTLGSLGNQQVVSGIGVDEQDATVLSGSSVVLGERFEGVATLKTLEEEPLVVEIKENSAVVDKPGVYGTGDKANALKLVVNPDPAGGNTLVFNEQQLETWFGSWGKEAWDWMNPHQPGEFLTSDDSNSHLAQWLLWAVLVLLLAELVLARIFSHALSSQPSLFSQTVKVIRGSGA